MGIAYGLGNLTAWITLAISFALFLSGVYAVFHCARTREDAYRAAGKWQKKYWLIALVVCTVLATGVFSITGLVISAVGILVYLLDAKPKVDELLRPRY